MEAVVVDYSKLAPMNAWTFTLFYICFQLSTEQTAQLGAELFIVRVSLFSLFLEHYIVVWFVCLFVWYLVFFFLTFKKLFILPVWVLCFHVCLCTAWR